MLERAPFGRTGRDSTRVIFGAAALAAMRPERVEGVIETLLEFGVDHLDTAAGYGDSERRLAPLLRQTRESFFLASKTGARDAAGARESIHRSLERLGVDRLDLIQLHNLTDEPGWQTALGAGGALEACVAAKSEGLVRFIGVTGHGTQAAAMHRRSLERFDFDSVLLPYSYVMMQSPEYRADFEALEAICHMRGVAIQTIKSVARRRWREDDASRRYSWYEPLRDAGAIHRAVAFVLARPGLFLCSSSDATILRTTLEAARDFAAGAEAWAGDAARPDDAALEHDARAFEMSPLFVRGVSDAI